ncbi:MAG: signal peptide peptidase SppA [Candidatus Limnocylindrales bacterium]|jgi:protease-4
MADMKHSQSPSPFGFQGAIRALIERRSRLRPGRVAIIRLYGTIGGGVRSADWVEIVKELRRRKSVPAVVLDIDSPGGSASASDYLYLALKRLSDQKPLVAHIRGTGASGSYLAAMAAQRIIVAPSSIIGSIGVISAGPRLPKLLDRLGVRVEEHRAGRLKGMGAPWRDETDEEGSREQQLVDAFYDRFVDRVVAGRGLERTRVLELATGEVWLGSEAVELGLADGTGDLDDAIEAAAAMAGVPAEASPVRLRRPLLARLTDRFATRLATTVADELEASLRRDRFM